MTLVKIGRALVITDSITGLSCYLIKFLYLCYSEREEEVALEQARQAHIAREQLTDIDKQKAQRDKERLKEQEKRRRMAVSTVNFCISGDTFSLDAMNL